MVEVPPDVVARVPFENLGRGLRRARQNPGRERRDVRPIDCHEDRLRLGPNNQALPRVLQRHPRRAIIGLLGKRDNPLKLADRGGPPPEVSLAMK